VYILELEQIENPRNDKLVGVGNVYVGIGGYFWMGLKGTLMRDTSIIQ